MRQSLLKLVDSAIESELAAHIDKLHAHGYTARILGEFVETLYKIGNIFAGGYFRTGLEILIPRILGRSGPSHQSHKEEVLLEAVRFASQYHGIRDLLYISFARKDSVIWAQEGCAVKASIADPTVLRQLAHERQVLFLNSSWQQAKPEGMVDVIPLLVGTKSWDLADKNVERALNSIEKEVDWKIGHCFSHLPRNSEIDLGGYFYFEFLLVYRQLLFLALYERNYSKANEVSCVIDYEERVLASALAKATDLKVDLCLRILREIASSSCSSLIRTDHQQYLLLPFCFSLKDGIAAILKKFAAADSGRFSSTCAGPIGSSLVNEVASYFRRYRNFSVLTDVSLRRFSADLPDIDCLVISYEPSLGFHFFVCEVKNNLPATCAKEYLKATGNGGYLEKAQAQAAKLKNFLDSQSGANLLYQWAVSEFNNLDFGAIFPRGFCGVVDFVIVTSQSIGMFYSDIDTSVICRDALRYIVYRSDGDVTYIQHHIRQWSEIIDRFYRIDVEEVVAGDLLIAYEGCVSESSFSLEENTYLSEGVLEEIERDARDTGYSFIDTISSFEKNR